MNNYLFKYDYAELRTRCRANSETDEGERNSLYGLVSVSANHRYPLRQIFARNPAPRGTPILIGAGWRSQTIGEIFKGTDGACADPDTRIFPATGAFTNSAFQFYSIDFYVTHRFFVTFFPEESNVSLVSLVPLVLFTPYIKGKDHHL